MSSHDRLHALDAVRAFALLLGVIFHAGFSFIPGMIPGLWAIVDNSPSTTLSVALFVSHIFRMSLFFFVAGFFARMLYQRGGARGFWANRAKRILAPLVVGWIVIFPMIAVVWIWGMTKTFGGTLPSMPPPPSPPGAFPLTHLWFLYHLMLLYIVVLVLRKAIVVIDRNGAIRRGADSVVRWLVTSGAAPLALALPTAVALYLRRDWIMWFGIPTPDSSVIPQAASVIGYGVALALRLAGASTDRPARRAGAPVAGSPRRRPGGDGAVPVARRPGAGIRAGGRHAADVRLRPRLHDRDLVLELRCHRRRDAVSVASRHPHPLRRRRVVLDLHRRTCRSSRRCR